MAKLLKYTTEAERAAVTAGSGMHFLGARENYVQGATMQRLARGGLAEVRVGRRPYSRLTYRLTLDGEAMRADLLRAAQRRCRCRPGLVERGGFSSRCPEHGYGD